jgi:epoxide hydrolase 4
MPRIPRFSPACCSPNPAQQKASQYMLLFRSPQAEAVLAANNYAVLTEVVLEEGLKTRVFREEDKAAYLRAWSQPPVPSEVAAKIGTSTANFAPDPTQLVVKVPTLVIWGEKDTALTTVNLDGLGEYVPEPTIQRVPDASHWVVHEKPAEVNGYIRGFIR